MNGRSFPTFRGEIRFTRNGGPYEKSDDEIVAIGFSRGRKFWDIEVADEPHTFALASGILTHNCKTSAMPESVRDRPTSAWEHIFMFSKSPRYYYDAEAVRTPNAREYERAGGAWAVNGADHLTGLQRNGTSQNGLSANAANPAGANLRNYWLLGPAPSSLEHFASFPPEIPRRCILAGTSARGACPACGAGWRRVVERSAMVVREGPGRSGLQAASLNATSRTAITGTMLAPASSETLGWEQGCSCPPADPVPQVVLDPFLGSGTTALVADRLGRDAICIELSEKYIAIARRRIVSDEQLFSEAIAVEVWQQPDLFAEAF